MGFNIKLKTIIKSTVNTSPLENKVKNPHRSQTLKLIMIQSSKLKSLHQRSDRRPTLESEQTGETPSKSRRRNFYASSDRSHCTPPERGEKKGEELNEPSRKSY